MSIAYCADIALTTSYAPLLAVSTPNSLTTTAPSDTAFPALGNIPTNFRGALYIPATIASPILIQSLQYTGTQSTFPASTAQKIELNGIDLSQVQIKCAGAGTVTLVGVLN